MCGKSLDIWLANNFQSSLIENESVIVSTFQNREYISVTEKFFQETETEKEDIKEKFHQFKNDFLNGFNEFKTKFSKQKTHDTRNI